MNGEHHHPKSRNTGVTVVATTSGASATVLYTCPSKNKGEIRILSVSNPTTAGVKVTVELYNNQASAYYKVVDSFNIAANSVLFVVNEGDKIFMNPSDKILISASTPSVLSSYISVTETYGEALA